MHSWGAFTWANWLSAKPNECDIRLFPNQTITILWCTNTPPPHSDYKQKNSIEKNINQNWCWIWKFLIEIISNCAFGNRCFSTFDVNAYVSLLHRINRITFRNDVQQNTASNMRLFATAILHDETISYRFRSDFFFFLKWMFHPCLLLACRNSWGNEGNIS